MKEQEDERELPLLRAEETCLLTVDMQQDFVSQQGFFGKVLQQDMRPVLEAMPRIASFLEYCRENALARVHVQVLHPEYTSARNWRGRLSGAAKKEPDICIPGSWGAEIVPELAPREAEPVVVKRRYDGFLDTDLMVILRTFKTRNLLVAGTKTNVCVDTTARHAFCNDFLTVTLADCVATPDPGMQETALWNLNSYFGYVRSSEEVKRKLLFENAKVAPPKSAQSEKLLTGR